MKTTAPSGEKIMAPAIPEEPTSDFETEITNIVPTHDESEMVSTIFDLIVSPIHVQDSPNFARDEKVLYEKMI